MALTITLNPDQEARLEQLAAENGCDVTCYVQRIIEQRLFDEKLKVGGVRFGNRKEAIALLDSWIGQDNDSDSTVAEWDEIQRNIERSRYWYEGTNA